MNYITFSKKVQQFCQFINVIDDDMWHAFFTTLYLSGMRKGEQLALNWHDIDFNKNIIIIDKTLSKNKKGKYKITATKTGVNREINMSNMLSKELLKYKEKVKQYGDFSEDWFVFGNGNMLSDYTIYKNKKKYFKLTSVNSITIHEFRHSHVSLCINEYLKSGYTDSTKFFLMMSQRMGHSLSVMQEIYMHLFPSTQDTIVDLLNNL